MRTALKMKCINELLKKEERDYSQWRIKVRTQRSSTQNPLDGGGAGSLEDSALMKVVGFLLDYLSLIIVVFTVVFCLTLYFYIKCSNRKQKDSMYGDVAVLEIPPEWTPRPSTLHRYPSSHPLDCGGGTNKDLSEV